MSEKSHPRAQNACVPCKTRKIKCDGDGDGATCSQCATRNIDCNYTERRMRGPSKSKDYVHVLEQRLRKLESLLSAQDSGIEGQPVPSEDAPGQSANAESNLQSIDSAKLIAGPVSKHTSILKRQAVDEALADETKRLRLGPGLGYVPVPALTKLPSVNDIIHIIHGGGTGPLPMRIFTPIHPYEDLLHIVGSVVDDINLSYPFFTLAYGTALGEYVMNPSTDPVKLALSESLFSVGMQWKTLNSDLGRFSPRIWSHFKNAFSTFPHLVTKGPSDISSHAMMLLAIFLQGSADLRTAIQTVTSAARLTQTSVVSEKTPDASNLHTTHDRKAFATILMLDTELSTKLNIPPAMDAEYVPLPSSDWHLDVDGQRREDICVMHIRLAILQSRIHKCFLLHNQQSQTTAKTVDLLDRELGDWKQALPSEVNYVGNKQTAVRALAVSTILMHFQYYEAKAKLLTMRATQGALDDFHRMCGGANSPLRVTPGTSNLARTTIRLLKALTEEQLCCLWRVLVYPLASAITLLVHVLQAPKSEAVKADITSLQELADYLSRLKLGHDCGLDKIQEACSMMHRVAKDATVTEDRVLPYRPDFGTAGVYFSELRGVLIPCKDYLSLAQRLMSNVPAMQTKTASKFSELLNIKWDGADEYGSLVPDVLKAERYDFRFEME